MNRDLQSLLDIVQSAEQVIEYVANVSWENFLNDVQLQDSVIRRLTVIGEAANRVSEERRLSLSSIEWSKIRGLRNRLVHEYDEIDLMIVWQIAQTEMTELVSTIKPVIPPEDPLFIF
jgi:uncharacterized protein with HEPN domain